MGEAWRLDQPDSDLPHCLSLAGIDSLGEGRSHRELAPDPVNAILLDLLGGNTSLSHCRPSLLREGVERAVISSVPWDIGLPPDEKMCLLEATLHN